MIGVDGPLLPRRLDLYQAVAINLTFNWHKIENSINGVNGEVDRAIKETIELKQTFFAPKNSENKYVIQFWCNYPGVL